MKSQAAKCLVPPDDSALGGDRTEEFVRCLSKYQQRVYSFILTLVPHWADADEILQETSTVLWRKFADFEPGTHGVMSRFHGYDSCIRHRVDTARRERNHQYQSEENRSSHISLPSMVDVT